VNLENPSENRQYLRLESAFSVEFTIVRLQGDLPGINWENGQTQNVSRGGLGLETENLAESTIRYLSTQNIYLDLRIHVPLTRLPIKAVCEVAWFEPSDDGKPGKYFIGLKFRSIAPNDLKKILGHANWRKLLSRIFNRSNR